MGRPPRQPTPAPDGEELPTGTKVRELLDTPSHFGEAAAVERRWQSRPLVVEKEPPLYLKEQVKLNVDPSLWGAGFLRVEEGFVPPEIYQALREMTPQAILRDLHRPVQQFFMRPEYVEGSQFHGLLDSAYRDIQGARKIEPLPVAEPLSRLMRSEALRRRRLLAERWQPVIPDDEERNTVHLYPPESSE